MKSTGKKFPPLKDLISLGGDIRMELIYGGLVHKGTVHRYSRPKL